MASPQCEDGFTRYANELHEAITKGDFNKREYKIVLAVGRGSFGWAQKSARITNAALAEATGLGLSHIGETIKKLLAAEVLFEANGALGIQKDYTRWKLPTTSQNRKVPKTGTSQNGNPNFPKQEPELPKMGTSTPLESAEGADSQAPKEKKETIKERHDMSVDALDEFLTAVCELMRGLRKESVLVDMTRAVSKARGITPATTRQWFSMPDVDKADWTLRALTQAKRKNAESPMPYAASVIADCLKEGTWPPPAAVFKQDAPPPIPKAKDRSLTLEALLDDYDGSSEVHFADYKAQKVAASGVPVDRMLIRQITAEKGLKAAMQELLLIARDHFQRKGAA